MCLIGHATSLRQSTAAIFKQELDPFCVEVGVYFCCIYIVCSRLPRGGLVRVADDVRMSKQSLDWSLAMADLISRFDAIEGD